ncbi:MAG: M20/M25/M40 family metallo-hydrolase, partial [Anaerolineales bacterium]
LPRTAPGVAEVVGDERTMGSEDMAYLMQTVPGCYFFIGSNNAEKELDFPYHHPRFDFDERAMVIGATLMAQAAAEYVIREQ